MKLVMEGGFGWEGKPTKLSGSKRGGGRRSVYTLGVTALTSQERRGDGRHSTIYKGGEMVGRYRTPN